MTQKTENTKIKAKKSLGQNFCKNKYLPEEIIKRLSIKPENQVWEIGPGTGALTDYLADKTSDLVLFEIDKRMKPILEQKFPFAKIVWGDFLKLDDHDLPENKEKILVCGNLPYYCATPIIRKFLVHGPKAERLVFLLQREVALKAAARSGSKDYGFLSLQIQFFAKAITGSTFGPESFSPPPKVKSTILELKPLPMNYQEKQKRLEILNQISVIFSQRRKIVLSLLKKRFPQTDWEDRFSLLKLDRKARPENLSLKQLYQLFSWI